jgi:hypothetical protein
LRAVHGGALGDEGMNPHITRYQAARMIIELRDNHTQLVDAFKKIESAFGSVIDSPVANACWGLFQSWLELLDMLIGGEGSTMLDWFVFENQWGAKGFEHSLPDGTMRAVHSIDDILDVMGY